MAQPHKGPRKQVSSTRVPEAVFDRLEREAQRLGVHKSDFIAHALCKEFGMEELSPLRGLDTQEQMRMTA
jgi:hypothetical protein